jgi:alcohol dehydrogenase (cytochrome c)
VGAGAALYFAYPVQVGTVAGAVRSTLLSYNEPPGTLKTEQNSAYKAPAAPAQPPASAPSAAAGDWPSYNRTLTTERYSDLG